MSALQVDQSDWDQIRVTGGDRVRFLQGMCTADISRLQVGQWVRALILNVKGRIVSVIDVVVGDNAVTLLCEPGLGDKTIEILSRFTIADDVAFQLHKAPLHRIWTDADSVWTAAPVFEAPGHAASTIEVECRRIEAGLPRFGIDVSEDNFPFESQLDRCVDYKKGCFIGQEPVARVHARGSGQRFLRGIAVTGSGPVALGSVVSHPAKDPAGIVTSAAESPVFGSIAMAYIHRSAWEAGLAVAVEGRAGVLVELPFRS